MTIDINKLRRKIISVDIVDHIDIHANVKSTLAELLDRLEVEEKDIALKERIIDSLGATLNAVASERDTLRARIEAMERQEPFDADSDVFRSAFEAALKAGNWPTTRQGDGYRAAYTHIAWRIAFSTVNRLKLYALPGAQPAPSVPADLITDYLVSISAHVAHQDDPKAQAEIGELLRMLAAAPEAAEKAVLEAYQREYLTGQEEIEKERDALRAELADLRSSMTFRTSLIGRIEAERDALRAKIEEMERQEPVAWCATDETGTVIESLGMNQSRRFDTALYLAPGAKGNRK